MQQQNQKTACWLKECSLAVGSGMVWDRMGGNEQPIGLQTNTFYVTLIRGAGSCRRACFGTL